MYIIVLLNLLYCMLSRDCYKKLEYVVKVKFLNELNFYIIILITSVTYVLYLILYNLYNQSVFNI